MKQPKKNRVPRPKASMFRPDILLSHQPQRPMQLIRGPLKTSPELHVFDTAQANYATDTTGSIQCINQIVQGVDVVNRLAREIVIKDVSVSGFNTPTATTGTNQQHRMLLVWDNGANAALPAIADVLSAVNTTSFPLVANVKRFTILWDHTVVLGTNTAAIADQTIKQYTHSVALNSACQFYGSATQIPQNGSILFITIGSNVAGVTAGITTAALRVTFWDTL